MTDVDERPPMDNQTAPKNTPCRQPSLAEFMQFTPADFVDQAYRVILRREPDPPGRSHYVTALCTGTLGRVEILDALSQSPEGRGHGVVINGLQGRAQLQRLLFGVPLLGKALRLGRRMAQLPTFLRMVTDMISTQQTLHDSVAALEAERQIFAAERQTLRAEQQELVHFLAERHHRAEVRLGILEAGVNSVQLETRRTVAEYRRYLLALEPVPVPAVTQQVAVSPQAASCGFGNSIYAGFEDEFRGSPDQVRQGLVPYLPLVREVARCHPTLPVIDLGCGRGEWLELIAADRIPVKGADLNPVVVLPLVEQGFDVTLTDVFSFLATQPDASAAVVTSFHLIEHLPPDQWISFLDEILRVLAPGGLAIIETPNPRNILVGAGDFYRDPSHHTPVFPDTLRYFGRVRGFDDSMAYYFVDERTRLVPADSWCFDTLEDYVRISRDYAWIGRKAL